MSVQIVMKQKTQSRSQNVISCPAVGMLGMRVRSEQFGRSCNKRLSLSTVNDAAQLFLKLQDGKQRITGETFFVW